MRRALALALTLSAANFAASAEDFNGKGLRPFVGIGFTSGGDTIQAVTLIPQGTTTQYKEDISAGGGLALQLGVSYRLGEAPVSLQASVGYHNDQTHGINGRSSFRRVPLEFLAQWHATERLRVGFGVRHSGYAKFSSSGYTTCTDDQTGATIPCTSYHERMKASTGLVLESEYMVTPYWGVKARLVHESYRFKSSEFDDQKYEGDHIGLLTSFYFN